MAPKGITMFSWGPGDSIVVGNGPLSLDKTSGESRGAGGFGGFGESEDAERRSAELREIPLQRPWALWRNRKDIQLPLQAFYGEGQSVWSQASSRAAAIGMSDEALEQRRASLPAEVYEYKDLYLQLMRRVSELGLRDSLPPEEAQAEATEFQALCELLYRGHQAWHLAHIVIKHLCPPPPNSHSDLAFDLVHWIQEHDPLDIYQDVKRSARLQPFAVRGGQNGPSEEWWGLLYKYIMHVWVDQADEMLAELTTEHAQRLGPKGEAVVEALRGLLQQLLEMENEVDHGRPLDMKWRAWTKQPLWGEIEQRLDPDLEIRSQVQTVINIMRGNGDDISAHGSGWTQCVVATMFYARSQNLLGVADLANVVEDTLAVWGEDGPEGQNTREQESVMIALMRLDLQQAVQFFSQHLHDWWSSAHLADVLFRGSLLPFSLQFAADMRAFAIKNYAQVLMASNGCWQVAAAYLKGTLESDVMSDDVGAVGGVARCAVRRSEVLHLLHDVVSRQKCHSDTNCRRLLAACPEHLHTLASHPTNPSLPPSPVSLFSPTELASLGGGSAATVQTMWGMTLHAKGRQAAALYWLSRGGSARVKEVADKALLQFVGASGEARLDSLEPILHYVEQTGGTEALADGAGAKVVRLIRKYSQLRQTVEKVNRLSTLPSRSRQQEEEKARYMEEAGALIKALLHPSSCAPRRFWRELVAYTVPLMEQETAGPYVFSSADILLFMQALQDLSVSDNIDTHTRTHTTDKHEVREEGMRLALARGLSVALQREALLTLPSRG